MTGRRFRLIRHHDVSGVSGTGPVAEGVQFTDGAVALRWYGDYPTTTVWDSIDSVIAIHGHGGATKVDWLDPEGGPDLELPVRSDLPPRPWPDLHSAPEPDPADLYDGADRLGVPDPMDEPGAPDRPQSQSGRPQMSRTPIGRSQLGRSQAGRTESAWAPAGPTDHDRIRRRGPGLT